MRTIVLKILFRKHFSKLPKLKYGDPGYYVLRPMSYLRSIVVKFRRPATQNLDEADDEVDDDDHLERNRCGCMAACVRHSFKVSTEVNRTPNSYSKGDAYYVLKVK